jgi:hypothetical protein
MRGRIGLFASLTLGLLILEEAADARIGGGQGYGRGGGGSRGGYSGGGGGGGGGAEAELLFLLIRLCIHYPAVGIPLLLIFIGFVIGRTYFDNGGARHVNRTQGASSHRVVARKAKRSSLDLLKDRDQAFSLPVLYDFLILLQRRAYEALSNNDWAALSTFVATSAIRDLQRENKGVSSTSQIVVGSVHLQRVQHQPRLTLLTVAFESTRIEETPSGSRRALVQETWTLRRANSAQSLEPEAILRMGCPSCGSAVETTPMGACPNCQTPITKGQLQWQVIKVDIRSRRPVKAPEVGFVKGGKEASVLLPTVLSSSISAEQRNLLGRHPDFDLDAFKGRVRTVYFELQGAWSAGRYDDIRPHVTDPMYQTLRFWMESYTQGGLRNQLDDIKLLKIALVRIELDAWYESITVRLWGEMKDYVVDETQKIVGGNAKTARTFSEYWTFLRAAGSGCDTRSDNQCPSCGASLDNVSASGICGYCDTKITSGQFDWVLSRIEQCEAYKGS